MNITSFIKHTRDAFISNGLAPSAYEINNGLCQEFAQALELAGFGEPCWQDELEDLTNFTFGEHKTEIENYCHHCFIIYKDKYYDAECPEGAWHPKDLPLFKKHISSLDKVEV